MQVIRDGVPQSVVVTPFLLAYVVWRTNYFFACFLLQQDGFTPVFCGHRPEFLQMSESRNIVTMSEYIVYLNSPGRAVGAPCLMSDCGGSLFAVFSKHKTYQS